MTGYIILGLFIIFICILFLRAFLFKPPKAVLPAMENADADEKSINRFVQLLKCKTVSSINPALAEISEFEKFRQLLKELYPNVHRICIPENIGPSGLLYTIKGKSNAAPVVLMSHYDVVPADEESWEKPPFEGILENGVLWGRGTLDTKGTLWGIMEAAENLISKGFIPENDKRKLLCEAALLAQPSLYEGFGLPPLEAMMSGTHVLISDIPVFREVYSDYPVNWFKAGDSDDLAKKLMELLMNKKPAPLNLPAALREKYSYNKTVTAILKEINNVSSVH